MRKRSAFLAAGMAGLWAVLQAGTAPADVLPRAGAPAGSVIARKAGEEARFIEVADWRSLDIRQDLLPGDVLRTNATGNLAILFSDRTQVRLGRNSTLVVLGIGTDGTDTQLSLESGQLWARAERGGEGVAVATPAATAAIRGTDWSMQVDGTGRTSLVVLEGTVELANAQGSVTVNQGEGASAAIGQAPSKLTFVNSDDREQMLYYYSLRTAFTLLPPSPLGSAEARAALARVEALPEGSRSTEDWTVLAETAILLRGKGVAQAAAERARRLAPSRAQAARLDLVEALVAGAEQRNGEAAALFARAAPALDPQRRAVALYGGYFARALSEPGRGEPPPSAAGGGAYGAVAEAFTASFLQDLPAAIAILKGAEKRFPGNALLPATRAQLALLLDDRDQVREALARALALDPDEPTALRARAQFRADRESDLDGALADLDHARAVAPGDADIWGELGSVQLERGAMREAEAAFRKAAALDPKDPVARANLASLLLYQNRLPEAEAEIEAASAADPSLDIMLTARGQYRLQKGDLDGALQDFLASGTANPAFATNLLLLATLHYERGEIDAAEQALDNADRIDPNDPAVAGLRTAAAIEAYDSDLAIASAQDALKRARARGGVYAGLSANRDEGSTLNEAYRLQGLDAWGRYYGDVVFDPFSASSLVDQLVSGSPAPFFTDLDFGGSATEPLANGGGFGLLFQSLLLEPSNLAGRSRSASYASRPFVEASIGGGIVAPDGGEAGWRADGSVQGFTASPFPISFFGEVTGLKDEDFREGGTTGPGTLGPVTSEGSFTLGDEDAVATAYLAAQPTPYDSVVAFVDYRNDRDALSDGAFSFQPSDLYEIVPIAVPGVGTVGVPFFLSTVGYDREVRDTSFSSGIAAAHTFGYRNVLSAGVFATGLERSSEERRRLGLNAVIDLGPGVDPLVVPFEGSIDSEGGFRQDALIGAVSHSVGLGGLTLRYGAEGGRVAQENSDATSLNIFGVTSVPVVTESETELTFATGRAYLDALYAFSPDLKVEAGLFGTVLAPTDVRFDGEEAEGITLTRLQPRLGLSWAVAPGQLLRIGYLEESGVSSNASLAPVGVVGLQSNQLPLSVTGEVETFAARWEAEWNSRLFTAVDYQHQEFEGLQILIPGGISTQDVGEGVLDRVSATVNYHLGGGFGLFGSVAHLESEDRTEDSLRAGESLPFLPDLTGRVGLSYVNPANLKVTLAASYVGDRTSNAAGVELDGFWTADAFLTWEPFDKRVALELAGYNLTGEEFEVAPTTPGWGRTFTGSISVRF